MQIIEAIDGMQQHALAARIAGTSIALVPTMGFLHDGHASLIREGRKRGGVVVVSVFVNPAQFGTNEDLAAYPRDLARDVKIAASAGADLIFAPSAAAMYPPGYQTYTEVEKLTIPLCGANRPGHFRGVTTVVGKLFNIIQPHVAIFGRKDFQQLAVIRRMVTDLNIPVEIIGMPIVREPDGLAMSSRNSYLSATERESALCLSKALMVSKALYQSGERDPFILRERALAVIGAEPAAVIEYAEFRDSDTLAEIIKADSRTLLALAVRIGNTRLIDNCILGEDK